jgi:hypothetical protein
VLGSLWTLVALDCIQDERDAPSQVVLGKVDASFCVFVSLGLLVVVSKFEIVN